MPPTRSKLGRTVALTAILAGTAFAQAHVKIQNTSKYVGGGRWDWTVFVDTDPATLQKIKCVQYTLPPTLANTVRDVCGQPETKFALSSNGWGTFTVKVKVEYKDGHVEDAERALIFEKEHAPASSTISAENWSRQIEPGWWEWGIHIKGPAAELDRIRCVEYTLHPSFPNHVRLVCARQNGFELTARGWGTFTVLIRLLFKDGSVRQMSHQLQFQPG